MKDSHQVKTKEKEEEEEVKNQKKESISDPFSKQTNKEERKK
jgi:hypothetical protein